MSNYIPPAPTWRLCHPVNIYVYRNGIENEKPYLVHIPMEKKKNMTTVLEAIGERMKLAVGYPVGLYQMDGQRVCKTYELEMYNNYVVVTNLEKRFKCVDYGKVREPLVVIGRCSKHVNTLKMQNKKFDLFCRQKMARKPLHELMANSGDQDGYGPSELPVGKPCGALCHKVAPRRDRPTQCCSDEIMCVEGAAMDLEKDVCREAQREMEKECMEERRRSLEEKTQCLAAPPGTKEDELVEELQRQVKEGGLDASVSNGPLGVNQNLVDLMLRYRDVGSDIFRMFQDKINRDLDPDAEGAVSARWQIPGGSKLDVETQQRVKEELIRLAEQSCQFTFDKQGNFMFSDGCRIPGVGTGTGFQSDMGVGTEASSQLGTSVKRTSGGDGGVPETMQRRLSQQEKEVPSSPRVGGKQSINQGSRSRRQSTWTIAERDANEDNSKSVGSMPTLTKSGSKKLEEAMAALEGEMVSDEEEMEKRTQMAQAQERKQSNKTRVSRMDSAITEIMGNMKRSLAFSRSNSGGMSPAKNSSPSPTPTRPLSAVQEEEELGYLEENGMDLIAEVKAAISNGSNKSLKNSEKSTSQKQMGAENGGNNEVNVFSLMLESRNPFREGLVPPLAGKLHKDRLDKLFAENPFRKHWFHGVDTPNDKFPEENEEGDNQNPFLKMLPPEGINFLHQPNLNSTFETPPFFSSQGSRTEWWPPKEPEVFLQQINELVQRHDNTKATSPPPPLPPSCVESVSTFTVGPSPRASQVKMRNVACGLSRTDMNSKGERVSPRLRNGGAQAAMSHVEIEEYPDRKEESSPRRKPRCYDGGTQTRNVEVETLWSGHLPSEDERPAGIYEGYQESIKSDMPYDGMSSDNDGDDERKVYYRKRKEHRRIRRKRKEHYLHPLHDHSFDEEEDGENNAPDNSTSVNVPKANQQVRFIINGNTPQLQLQQYPQSSPCFPAILSSQAPSQQQPLLVQASSTTPTTLPLVARHPTQSSSPTILKSIQGGIITGPHSPIPFMLSQQQGGGIGRGGLLLTAPLINNNMITGSSSPLVRQPIVLSTTNSPQSQQNQQQPAKFLPVLQPQSTSMRLIRVINPTQQFFTSPTSSTAGGGGMLQNKLVQMMPPAFSPVLISSQQQMMHRPQQPQQQLQPQPQPPAQQFIFK